MTLQESLSSAGQPDAGAGDGGGAAPVEGNGAALETGAAADPQGSPQPGWIGLGEEEATGTETQIALKIALAEGTDPNMVIGKDDNGQEYTLQQLRDGYLRQQDYTVKTQEISARKGELDWLDGNRATFEALGHQDVQTRVAAILEIAKGVGVDPAMLGGSSDKPRDPSGRFAKAAEDLDLDPNDPRDAAILKMMERFEELDKGREAQQNQEQQMREMEAHRQQAAQVLGRWEANGFKASPESIQKASSLLGQPMNAEIALIIANFKSLVEHNARLATQNGAAGGGSQAIPAGGERAGVRAGDFKDPEAFTQAKRGW